VDTQKARFRLFIDESGDHVGSESYSELSRYIGLLGVWFRTTKRRRETEDDYTRFVDDVRTFKNNLFGPRPEKPVILHRRDIIDRKGPFGILSDPGVRARFDDGLIGLFNRANFTLVCVVIDKHDIVGRHGITAHSYHIGLAAMLDSYCGWLNQKNAVGDAIAEARGRREDRALKKAYSGVYETGTATFDSETFQRVLTSKNLKIEPKSANIFGLQLADLLANPVKRLLLWEKRHGYDPRCGFNTRLLKVIEKKFNQDHLTQDHLTGNVWKFGKKWL